MVSDSEETAVFACVSNKSFCCTVLEILAQYGGDSPSKHIGEVCEMIVAVHGRYFVSQGKGCCHPMVEESDMS